MTALLGEPKSVSAQNVTLKVRPIKQDEPGFLPRWRRLISIQRAMVDFNNTKPEDIDEIYELLCEYITDPADRASKVAILDTITIQELTDIFSIVIGADIVPPASGGA